MNIHYFLGANSRRGFYSLYDSFPPGEGSFLHIIKGGPGNGKSGFMRRLAVAAEDEGGGVHARRRKQGGKQSQGPQPPGGHAGEGTALQGGEVGKIIPVRKGLSKK